MRVGDKCKRTYIFSGKRCNGTLRRHPYKDGLRCDQCRAWECFETSEEKLDLPNQPEDSCPQIDEGLRAVSDALTYVKEAQHEVGYEAVATVESLLVDVEGRISELADVLEFCRSQCEALRSWGQGWKDLAKSLQEKLDDADNGGNGYA